MSSDTLRLSEEALRDESYWRVDHHVLGRLREKLDAEDFQMALA